MKNVYEFAKYLMKSNIDSLKNTYDGNMKLQKLLVLANLINIAENNEPLFNEEILAFKNGCVVEKVRLRYKVDYDGFRRDSEVFEPDFTEKEYEALSLTNKIFGNVSARELSEINHTFDFWKEAYENGTDANGYHDKGRSVVDMMSYEEDIERMRDIISAYRESSENVTDYEVINGITFYYDGFSLTDSIIEELESFSLLADEDAYSVYVDGGELVIY